MMNVARNQFSLTRVAAKRAPRQKTKFLLSVDVEAGRVSPVRRNAGKLLIGHGRRLLRACKAGQSWGSDLQASL